MIVTCKVELRATLCTHARSLEQDHHQGFCVQGFPFMQFTNVFISQALIWLFAQTPNLKQHNPIAPNVTGTGV